VGFLMVNASLTYIGTEGKWYVLTASVEPIHLFSIQAQTFDAGQEVIDIRAWRIILFQ